MRQDLLAVMGILAGGKYAAEMVYSMIRREMIMQSPIYQDWVKEEARVIINDGVDVPQTRRRAFPQVGEIIQEYKRGKESRGDKK